MNRRPRFFAFLLPALTLLLVGLPARAQQGNYVREHYVKREVEIPMRDGVKLFTSIYAPKDSSKPAPFLMMRTPYSCAPYGPDAYRNALGPEREFTQEGYIFVTQDVRGRYMSGGDFHWMTPYIPNKKPGQVDESTDTWDTIDWLLKDVPNNNGRVGIYGTSFPGHYAAQALIDPHPALKAASPQAPMADNWLGDDMHHGGCFWTPHAMNFIAGFGKHRDGPTQNYGPPVFQHGTPDGYRFFLEMGPLKNADEQYLHHRIALWDEWMEHGDYDAYWQPQNVPQHLGHVGDVAVLTVGGWWDAEDLAGPLAIYRSIERKNPSNNSRLVMGPWYHGSWNFGPGTSLYDISWQTHAGDDFRNNLQRPFFREYLWGDAHADIAKVTMFDDGTDAWRKYPRWPPAESHPLSLVLRPGHKLEMGGGEGDDKAHRFDEYVSDPERPVPCSAEISVGMPRQYMIEDQRFVWKRPDVLAYETPPLAEPVTLAGPVTAALYVSTTGTDADFVVKLIDEYPNDAPDNSPRGPEVRMGGYQMMVRGEPMRAKYRHSWSHPEPLTPGKVEKVEFTLPDICHTFRKGHRMMVQIHSTWFPLMDRNPGKFCNIYRASEGDFHKTTQRIYLAGPTDSHLTVTALPGASAQ